MPKLGSYIFGGNSADSIPERNNNNFAPKSSGSFLRPFTPSIGGLRKFGGTLINPQHTVNIPAMSQVVSYNLPNVGSSFNGTEQRFEHRIEAKALHKMVGLSLRWKLTLSVANSRLIGAPFFVNRIEFRSAGGSGDVIQTLHPESQLLLTGMLPEGTRAEYAHIGNYTNKWGADPDRNLISGQQVTFESPLLATFFESHGGIDAQTLSEDILMVIYTRPSIVSSGGGTVTLNELTLLIDHVEHKVDSIGMQARRLLNMSPIASNYLDVVRIPRSSNTITAATNFRFDLDTLENKKCPFLLFGVRASNTGVADQGITKFLNLGIENTTIDIVNASGQSIWGRGSAIDATHLKHVIMGQHFESDFGKYTNLYVIPFTEDIKQAVAGIMSGYYQFPDGQHQLSITPGAVAVAEIHSLTCTSAGNDSGVYRWLFQGEASAPLAFNANVAAMKTAFEAMDSVIGWPGGCTVTFDSTLETTATCTFGDSRRYPLIGVICESLADGGVGDSITVTRSTVGNGGWTTTTTASFDCYAFYFKELHQEGGKLHTRNL